MLKVGINTHAPLLESSALKQALDLLRPVVMAQKDNLESFYDRLYDLLPLLMRPTYKSEDEALQAVGALKRLDGSVIRHLMTIPPYVLSEQMWPEHKFEIMLFEQWADSLTEGLSA